MGGTGKNYKEKAADRAMECLLLRPTVHAQPGCKLLQASSQEDEWQPVQPGWVYLVMSSSVQLPSAAFITLPQTPAQTSYGEDCSAGFQTNLTF